MTAVGIDLGTTNCVVAHVNENGVVEVIPSREGGRTTPSVFAIAEDGTKLVGKPACDQESLNAERTIRSIKRQMGTNFRAVFDDGEMSPEEISAEILMKIKLDCEAYLGESVTQAVITVPAYFDNNQRTSTKTAGELAGLEVLRIINEPTAAALAYGMDKRRNQTILIFDLGGGTFDVTVLKTSDLGVFEVKATSGDTHLGGDDFDSSLMRLIRSKVPGYRLYMPDEMAVMSVDVDALPEVWLDVTGAARLRGAAEQAKKDLSASTSAQVYVPFIAFDAITNKPIHVKVTVTRDEFEQRIDNDVSRTLKCVGMALKDADIVCTQLDEVVFVGGSTRVPYVEQQVESYTRKKPNHSINPDEAVAVGAAVQAAMLTGAREKDVLLVDVTPLTLGVETLGGVMTPLITRNTVIPCEKAEAFTTAEDNQRVVDVKVYQGERPQTKDNRFLGEFHMVEIAPAPRGVPDIEVTFIIDANGILSVKAADKVTGAAQTVTITGNSSLTSEEISRLLADAEANRDADNIFQEKAVAKEVVYDKLRQVDELLRTAIDILDSGTIEDLKDMQDSLEQALADDRGHLEFLNSLGLAAAESIKKASKAVYDKAGEGIEPKAG